MASGHWLQPSTDAAVGAALWGTAAVKAEEAAGAEDAYFDQFFEPLQSMIPTLMIPMTEDAQFGNEALFDSGTEDYLRTLLLTDASELGLEQRQWQPIPADQAESESAPDDDESPSPASFDGLASPMPATPAPSPVSMMTSPAAASSAIMSLPAPTSPAPSSRSIASSSHSSKSFGSGVSGGGRVDKKKEANREAAYRYRMKQRLGDTALDQRRAELQTRADDLAGGVGRAEDEARFLIQMCRQIFSSRKQLLLASTGRLAHD